MKPTKIKKWISNITTALLLIVFMFMLFIVISTKASGGEPQIFGYQIKTVLSGSMEPEIKTGSIISVKPGGDMERFEVGDIITFFQEKDVLVTHRITEVINSGENVMYRTKGDNNIKEDLNPVLSENVVAVYADFTVPYLGYFIEFAKSKNGSAVLMILPGILLFSYSIFTILTTISRLEKQVKQSKDIEEPKSAS
ncbi:signal peptidase I [Sutcliffiella horikoshii]|uniref:signal peptidase I SipW n=1 Tax=Sutcliffiella horikoshii TaxID=79883 RepID=UPI0007D07BC1|nr:signal peptidase I [Sutcliffiella horikoshii]MCM3618858.1 signal peptidase I [Sutcliffiella horikoshii]